MILLALLLSSMKTHWMSIRALLLVLFLGCTGVCIFGSAQLAWSEVIGTGLLGATEEEIVKKLGPPDLKRTNQLNQDRKPAAAVIKFVDFLWKKNEDKSTRDVFMTIGFDAKGLARTIKGDGGFVLSPPGMGQFCNAVADGPWQADKDANAMFATTASQSLLFDEYTQSLWRDTGLGVKLLQGKVGFAKVAGVQSEAKGKTVSRSKDGRVYVICDLNFNSRYGNKVWCSAIELCDTETFWSRILDDLLTLWKDGPPSGSSIKSAPPPKFAPSPLRPNDHYRVTAHRLANAVVAMVRNPGVDLKQTRLPTGILRDWPDPYFTTKLIELLKKDATPIRASVAEMFAEFDDPVIVTPLIDALKGKTPLPAAATALQSIAGKDLGADPAAWQQWWKENRKTVQDRFDARMHDACGPLHVWVAGKQFHLLGCPSAKNVYDKTIKEARLIGKPCPKCKPPR